MEASGRGIPLDMLQVVLKVRNKLLPNRISSTKKILDGSKPIDNPMPFEYAIKR